MARKITRREPPIIAEYVRMWPCEIYNIKVGLGPVKSLKEALDHMAGVYVLYCDDHPYYIGRAIGSLWQKIGDHALDRNDTYYNYWNFFSAFIVNDLHHINEIEGVLIAAFSEVTANSARRRIKRIKLPRDVAKALKKENRIAIEPNE